MLVQLRTVLSVLFLLLLPIIAVCQHGPMGIGNTDGSPTAAGPQPRLLLWLDGSSASPFANNVSLVSWNDKSGNGHNFVPYYAGAVYPPQVKTSGPLSGPKGTFSGAPETPVVKFINRDDWVYCADFELPGDGYTIYFVVKSSDSNYGLFSYASPTVEREMLIYNDNGIRQQMNNTLDRASAIGDINGGWNYGGILLDTSNDDNWEYNKNTPYELGYNTFDGITFSATGSAMIGEIQNASGIYPTFPQTTMLPTNFIGDIAEIFIYEGRLSRPATRLLRTYLWVKYGLNGDDGDWDKFHGNMDTDAGNPWGGKYYAPIGIGNDVVGLNAGAINEARSSGLVLRVNEGNYTQTQSYLCAAPVGNSLTGLLPNAIVTDGVIAPVLNRWSRLWEIAGSSEGNDQVFEIAFDFGEGIDGDIPQNPENFVLLYRDNPTSGDFSILPVPNSMKFVSDDELVFKIPKSSLLTPHRYYTIGTTNPSSSLTDCDNFKLYYIAMGTPGVAAGTVFEGVISGGNVQLTELFQSGLNGHMALNTDNGNIYVIEGNGSRIRTFSPDGDFISEVLLSGLSRTYAMAYDPSNSKLYVGSANANKVYKLDPETGDHIVFAEDVPVEGGDIVVDGDQVYLIEQRDSIGSRLYNITSGDDVFVSNIVSSVNGAAQTANGGLIAAEGGGSSSFWTYDFDGSNEQELQVIDANGDSFIIVDGDIASGCNLGNNNEDGCDYNLYYRHVASGNASADGLYSLTLNDDATADEAFITNEGDSVIALSPDGLLIYMVGGSNIFTYDVVTEAITSVNIFNGANGVNLSGFSSAVADSDGNVFIGGAGNNVWQVNPQSGESFLIASGISVNGGDLIVAPTGGDGADELWIITRNNNRFTRVLDPSNGSFTVAVTEINGAAVLENGNVLLANGDGSNEFVEVSLQDDITFGSVVGSYLTDLPLFNGDLAGGCTNSDSHDICGGDNGNCYGTVDAYVKGTRSNGGAISESMADTSNASGMPERTDNLVFTTLGYGGSIVFKFQGVVPNGPGDDIEVVETSFNTLGCESYPEYAVVSVSQDDITYFTLQTICKGEPFADISNAVDANGESVALDCVMYVKVENEDNLTTTPDGFDVDGIVAIHNCDDSDSNPNID